MADVKLDVDGAGEKYTRKRAELLDAEIALKDQRERVAALRRQLPLGPEVKEDYLFREGPADLARNDPADFVDVRLSELFAPGKDQLIVDHMMYGPEMEQGCPMCSMWADSYNAVVPHVTDRANFVLVAKRELSELRTWAKGRGWDQIRILSSERSTFNADYRVEQGGGQLPACSVFVKTPAGKIHHFYTTQASLVFSNHRGIDLMSPVWNLFDLLPDGRGDWFPQQSYQ